MKDSLLKLSLQSYCNDVKRVSKENQSKNAGHFQFPPNKSKYGLLFSFSTGCWWCWWYIPVIPVLARQRQIANFKANLVLVQGILGLHEEALSWIPMLLINVGNEIDALHISEGNYSFPITNDGIVFRRYISVWKWYVFIRNCSFIFNFEIVIYLQYFFLPFLSPNSDTHPCPLSSKFVASFFSTNGWVCVCVYIYSPKHSLFIFYVVQYCIFIQASHMIWYVPRMLGRNSELQPSEGTKNNLWDTVVPCDIFNLFCVLYIDWESMKIYIKSSISGIC